MCSLFLRHWWAVCWCSFSSAAVLFSSLTPLSFSQGVSGDADAASCRGESVSVPLSSGTYICMPTQWQSVNRIINLLSSLCVRVKPVGPSNVLSMAQLRTLPLGEQVKTLMKNGRITWQRTAFYFILFIFYNVLLLLFFNTHANIHGSQHFLCSFSLYHVGALKHKRQHHHHTIHFAVSPLQWR